MRLVEELEYQSKFSHGAAAQKCGEAAWAIRDLEKEIVELKRKHEEEISRMREPSRLASLEDDRDLQIEEQQEEIDTLKTKLSEAEEQRRSFAYGNAHLSNPEVTREMVDRAAEALDPSGSAAPTPEDPPRSADPPDRAEHSGPPHFYTRQVDDPKLGDRVVFIARSKLLRGTIIGFRLGGCACEIDVEGHCGHIRPVSDVMQESELPTKE